MQVIISIRANHLCELGELINTNRFEIGIIALEIFTDSFQHNTLALVL